MATNPFAAYTRLSRAPRYSLLFALPLLLLYEALAFALSHDAIAGVRNGADVLLKSLFVGFGGRDGLIVFGALLIGWGAVLVGRDLRRSGGRLEGRIFGGMVIESVFYGLAFGVVAGQLTALLLHAVPGLSVGGLAAFDLPTQLMISLGAGLYEELLFRVLLVSGLAMLARSLFGWSARGAGIFATLLGATIFSAFHYVGAYGDPFEVGSFLFRLIAGILFSAMYLLRGFGITAWSHALYDVFLTLAT